MKTKETSKCNLCGGNSKPSKGILNTHNIQTSNKNKEFESNLIDCLKCEECGHSWIPDYNLDIPVISTREQGLAWWNKLDALRKVLKKPDNRTLESLTGREIEEIWRKETGERGIIITNLSKPNEKQFKQFDESLFKAYIDKFSDEDKLKMLNFLTSNISKIKSWK